MNASKSDNIYLNSTINAGSESILASSSINRVQEILSKPNDYELTIARFSIPISTIPMMFFKENFWSLTLKRDTVIQTKYLQFVPNTTETGRDAIYTFQEFIDIINNAFSSAYTDLVAAVLPTVLSSDFPPFLTFDPVTKLITMNVQQNYLADNIKIYFNRELHNLMSSFFTYFNSAVGELTYEIIVADRITNTSSLNGQLSYEMVQDYKTIASWSMLQSIRIESSSIPIHRELEGAQQNITSSLLTDFNVPSGEYDRSDLIFFPQGPLRFLDLNSAYPLNQIDFDILYETKDGERIRHRLNPGESLNIKFYFKRKSEKRLTEYIDSLILEDEDE